MTFIETDFTMKLLIHIEKKQVKEKWNMIAWWSESVCE